jgi:hypothetical protein
MKQTAMLTVASGKELKYTSSQEGKSSIQLPLVNWVSPTALRLESYLFPIKPSDETIA